jgi:transposase-like protein
MGQRSKYRKFTEAYRELAVRRLLETDNVSELCREMRISRQLLYQWRDKLAREKEKQDPAQAPERQLRQENAQLKRALAEKTLQVDFLRGAFEKVEALRQPRTGNGATASTPKSGN